MSQGRWKEIEWARKKLGLPEQVSFVEIKEAYHSCCRESHPDLARTEEDRAEKEKEMVDINRAYQILFDYAQHYTIVLTPNEQGMSDEDWWMHHFGQDPIWAGEREE